MPRRFCTMPGMADPSHLYALPPGADFPAELVAGLLEKLAGQPPEALARVTLILNLSLIHI